MNTVNEKKTAPELPAPSGKKTRKLAMQVSLMVTAAFTVLLILIGAVVTRGTRKMFIESQNEQIRWDLLECKGLFMDPSIVDWVLSAWQNDPSMLDEPATDVENEMFDALRYDTAAATNINMDLVEDLWSEEIRRSFQKAMYRYLVFWFDGERKEGRFGSAFLVDIRADDDLYGQARDDVMVILESSEETDKTGNHNLGQFVSVKETYHSFDVFQNGEYGKDFGDEVFKTLKDTTYNQTIYLAMAPMFVDGVLRYVVCLEYDWTVFAQILNDNLKSIVLWGGISLILVTGLLILLMYVRAVRPMVQVNDGIRAYVETKDSDAAVQSMAKIKEKNEVGKLADSIAFMAVEIERYTQENLRISAERQRLGAELDLAASIQSGQLPSRFPAFPDRKEFDIFASMTPAKSVGGDFYDFFLVDADHIALVMADVSGKGVPAALFMMVSRILIKNHLQAGESPAQALASVNRQLLENNQARLFVTVWLAVLELSTGRGIAANAGHEHPALRRSGGQYELVEYKHASPVGILKRAQFTEHDFALHPGDSLFVYTDGVAEAANRNEELFGTARMLAALNAAPDADCAGTLENMMNSIRTFVDGAEQFDDITMLCFQYFGSTPDDPA